MTAEVNASGRVTCMKLCSSDVVYAGIRVRGSVHYNNLRNAINEL